MTIKEQAKEFWKANHREYWISSFIVSILGMMLYAFKIQSNPYEHLETITSLVIIGFGFVGVFILMWGAFILLYKRK